MGSKPESLSHSGINAYKSCVLLKNNLIHFLYRQTLLRCGECSGTFSTVRGYIKHGKAVHDNILFQCPQCPSGDWYQPTSLKEHLLDHERSHLYQCKICSKAQPVTEYRAHQYRHIVSLKRCFCAW
jgi:hypothetical protein